MENEKLNINSNTLIIDANFDNQRIDNFLIRKLKNLPKSKIYRMIRVGTIRINKKRIKPHYKLKYGDKIIVPFFKNTKKSIDNIKPNINIMQKLENSIIFEDKKIIAINKPFGIAAHGGSGINFGIIEYFRNIKNDFENLELVHRLDKDTSGCMIIAKRRSALREINSMLRDGKIIKKYILFVKGQWKGKDCIVDAPLLKINYGNERMVKVNPDGKKSLTIFKPIKIGTNFSLLLAELKTGRTHQIRVHASHIGYPIIGDDKYGDKLFNNLMKKNGIKRMLLHSYIINFYWNDNTKIELKAKLDNEFRLLMGDIEDYILYVNSEL